jgi:hypothetical protein
MKALKYVLICLFWQINSILVFSQSVEYINGKIINSVTLEPVPFTTIRLKNNQLGVFANSAGDFKVVRFPEIMDDSLIITCIGFIRYSILFKDLSEKDVNKIYLAPAIYGLGEVEVLASRKKINPVLVVSRAIRNIKNNYPVEPFNYISYYRDYQKREGAYINLNEAIVQTLDGGFITESPLNRYRMIDYKENVDFSRINISPYYERIEFKNSYTTDKVIPNAKLGDQFGNELFVLMASDAIRNFEVRSFSFVNILSTDFIKNHNFSVPTAIYNNNLLLYKIVFNARSRIIGNALDVLGAIYIQPKDYSIHKFEYTCSYLSKDKGKKEMFSVDIEYGYEASVDSLMCLKYISFNNIFNVVDTEDITYFRILKSYWDTSDRLRTVLNIDFNYKLDQVSALKKENYEIVIGGKIAKIADIKVNGKNVKIRLKEDKLKAKRDSCYVNVLFVKDFNGNFLDSRKKIELYQYSELFVQEYNKSLPVTDSCYMQYKPLNQNCISKFSGKDKYWMNTPENIKNVK